MKKLAIFATILASGCATTNSVLDANYAEYLKTQREFAHADRPLLRIKSQPGATIKMEGVDEFVVYVPSQHNNIATYQPPRNDAVEITKSVVGAVSTIGGIMAAGNAAKGLATAVGNASNHGYSFVQAPGDSFNVTGVLGSGTYTNSYIAYPPTK